MWLRGREKGREESAKYVCRELFRRDMMKGKRRWFQGQHLIGLASIYQNNLSFLFLFPTNPEISLKVKKKTIGFFFEIENQIFN